GARAARTSTGSVMYRYAVVVSMGLRLSVTPTGTPARQVGEISVSHPARPDPSTAIFTTADGVRIVTLRGDLDKDAREPGHETR
ncbi:hypothetical protein ACFVYN_41260, partial [Streptomyces sp. NPDC058307]